MATETAPPAADPPPPPPVPPPPPAAPDAPPPPPVESQVPPGAQPKPPLPFEPQNADDMYRYAVMMCRSSLLPRAFYDKEDRDRKNPRIGDVMFVLMKGQALGLHPQVSIGTIHVIDGKAEIGALLMVSLCRKSGVCEYFQLVSSDDRQATYRTKRRGDPEPVEFKYTIEEADQMGLLEKGGSDWAKANNQWKKQPRTMLRRRAQSMLAREVYPDVVMGLYDYDELAEMREREAALGIDSDRVIQVEGRERAGGVPDPLALPAPGEKISLRAEPKTDDREFVPAKRADPLMERLRGRKEAQATLDVDGPPVLGHGEVHCADCGVPVLGAKGAKCAACKAS